MPVKYQVFISSTFNDLKDERDQIIKATLEMGHIPVGMEMFSAGDEEQWKIIKRHIDDVDYYAVVVAHRYGSVTTEGISYTEKEYDYAKSIGVPVLGFLIDDSAPWPADRMDKDAKKKVSLNDFKEKIKQKMVQFWKSKDDLHGKFSISLMKSINEVPRPGWAKANEIAGPEVIKELTRLSSENSRLREQIERLKRSADETKDEVRNVTKILFNNKKKINIRTSDDWEKAQKIETNLLDIFLAIAPDLMGESSSQDISKLIAFKFVGKKRHHTWPVGANIVSDLIANFGALDLMDPSKKKHSVRDKNNYWSLSKIGMEVLKNANRITLEEGLKSETETADDTKK